MKMRSSQRWMVYAMGCGFLIGIVALQSTPVISQGPSNQSRYEYRVIEVPPDTQSIQSALNEYGGAGWELAAFEMGELQAPKLVFKKGIPGAR
ncbi:hypothetical protein [Petrachloros mirabilis]